MRGRPITVDVPLRVLFPFAFAPLLANLLFYFSALLGESIMGKGRGTG